MRSQRIIAKANRILESSETEIGGCVKIDDIGTVLHRCPATGKWTSGGLATLCSNDPDPRVVAYDAVKCVIRRATMEESDQMGLIDAMRELSPFVFLSA